MKAFKIAAGIFFFAMIHFAIGFVAILVVVTRELSNVPVRDRLLYHEVEFLTEVLWSPGLQIAKMIGVEQTEPAIFLLALGNSLLWGLVLFGIYSAAMCLRKRFEQHKP